LGSPCFSRPHFGSPPTCAQPCRSSQVATTDGGQPEAQQSITTAASCFMPSQTIEFFCHLEFNRNNWCKSNCQSSAAFAHALRQHQRYSCKWSRPARQRLFRAQRCVRELSACCRCTLDLRFLLHYIKLYILLHLQVLTHEQLGEVKRTRAAEKLLIGMKNTAST
jgi:hypothetical protein